MTSIGNYAFRSCSSLASVTIGNSVTDFGWHTFSLCYNLTCVKVGKEKPVDLNWSTFPERSEAILIVPIGSKASYKAAYNWREFKKIVEYIEGDVNADEDVNVVDVVDIARFIVGTPANTFVELMADINKDNDVNLGDAVALVNNIAGDQNFVKAWNNPSQETANDVLNLTECCRGLSLTLDNERRYTAFQFDLFVPKDADVTQMTMNAERKQGHQLLYNKVEDGHYRVAALSVNNNDFNGNNGELLNLALSGEDNTEVSIRNIHFYDAIGHDYLFEDVYGSSPTSIRQIDNGPLTIDNYVYDLQGRKRVELKPGINIVGGKKVVVK